MIEEMARLLVGPAAALIPYLEDREITDLLINGSQSFYVEIKGELLRKDPLVFQNPPGLSQLIERLLISVGKRVDATRPFADGRLPDGSRFHIMLPPLAVEGPLISIRKRRELSAWGLEAFGDAALVEWLSDKVLQKKNLLIGGATGAGKTSLLSCLLDCVPASERILLLEETLELHSIHPHLFHLEARAASAEGTGEVTLRELLRNALRMRPDRIVLGECRGGEAFDLLSAMNTGHKGSFCTIHCNSAVDALKRLEGLTLLSGFGLNALRVREWVASVIDYVIFVERQDGKRKVAEIIAVQGVEGEQYRITPLLGGRFGEATRLLQLG